MAVCHVIRKELTETFDFWVAWGTSLEWRYSHVVSQKPSTHPASYVLVVIQLTADMYRRIGILYLHLHTNWWFGHSEISGHFKSLLLNEPFMRSQHQFRNSYPKRHTSRVKSDLLHPLRLHSGKLTWQWKITMFNREYIFKRSTFHCHLSLPEGNTTIFRNHTLNLDQLWISLTSIHG